jgi:hypothetical protein
MVQKTESKLDKTIMEKMNQIHELIFNSNLNDLQKTLFKKQWDKLKCYGNHTTKLNRLNELENAIRVFSSLERN